MWQCKTFQIFIISRLNCLIFEKTSVHIYDISISWEYSFEHNVWNFQSSFVIKVQKRSYKCQIKYLTSSLSFLKSEILKFFFVILVLFAYETLSTWSNIFACFREIVTVSPTETISPKFRFVADTDIFTSCCCKWFNFSRYIFSSQKAWVVIRLKIR